MADSAKRGCTILLVTRNGMGHADPSLQQELFAKYLRPLDENNMLPGGICFYTEGVRLVSEGSPSWTCSARSRSVASPCSSASPA
jgi:hypothetical protein